jgi:integrase
VKKNQTVSLNALHPETVNELIRQAVARTGMSEADVAEFSGHSLRSGFVTSARAAGVPDHVIMRTTRHKDQRMLQTYTRTPEFFETAATWASW